LIEQLFGSYLAVIFPTEDPVWKLFLSTQVKAWCGKPTEKKGLL